MLDRAAIIDEQFRNRLKRQDFPKRFSTCTFNEANLECSTAISLFDSQIKSRHLDMMARTLKEKQLSYYTIGSSGHEGNAVFGQVFKKTDMAFLHYRSGAFFLQRAKQDNCIDGVKDILLSLVASANDPISGGRHKVFGSKLLNIPPQTSTIASHLPKALGTAFSLNRAKEMGIDSQIPNDAVILCSFGDASINHASAQTSLNAASWLGSQPYPLPLIFICEDNGLGISVPTPSNWIKHSIEGRAHIHYLTCDGLNIADVYRVARQADFMARVKKQVVFIHMKCVRLMGHAGSDIESVYKTVQEIEAMEANDPLLHTASLLLDEGVMSVDDMLDLYDTNLELIQAKALDILPAPQLSSSHEIMSPITPPKTLGDKKKTLPDDECREKTFGTAYSQLSKKRNLSQLINFALTDLMLQYNNMIVFGEDVGKKGGVYCVTTDLQKRFGRRRVFDTILDETTILGTAIGMAHNGFIPVPEIQFLAYLHNAEDQLRGEASTLSFFSNGQFQNPMVLRIASFAYQKGFGGHFHNDNSIAVLRDLPGVIVVAPSNGRSAVKLLRTCLRLASEENRVVVFLEPIALYMTKDLHESGDGQWLFEYPALSESIAYGAVESYGQGQTVILTYANGYYLSRQAEKILSEQYKLRVKVVDIQWLNPLPEESILKEISKATNVLIVDEGRKSGSVSEALMTLIVEKSPNQLNVQRITGEDSFIPLGSAWTHLLPSKDKIVDAVLELSQHRIQHLSHNRQLEQEKHRG